jgi:glycosyltransferase involved in cell wall biosynthesis
MQTRIIPNGFDSDAWGEQQVSCVGSSFKYPWRTPDAWVFAHVGRVHPMKNHIGLIKAFDRLALSKPNVQLVLVGRGTANIDINEYISNSRIHTLGERENIPELMSTFDALVLCSLYGEGFPNVVGEAMLTGLPVIVTDVGDSALMTGGNGITIPANSPSHLYHAMCEIMSWDVERLDSVRVRSRQHIINNYDILAVADRYEKLWRDLYQQTLS